MQRHQFCGTHDDTRVPQQPAPLCQWQCSALWRRTARGTMGWCHGFQLHLLCNDSGEIITFLSTGANVDDRGQRVCGQSFAKEPRKGPPTGDTSTDRGSFEDLRQGHTSAWIAANMKNRLMSMGCKIMLAKGTSLNVSTTCSKTRQTSYSLEASFHTQTSS